VLSLSSCPTLSNHRSSPRQIYKHVSSSTFSERLTDHHYRDRGF
jgi:hypothetical protein